MHVIFISSNGLILTSGIKARLFLSYPLQESLTVEWESHGQVGVMVDEGKLRLIGLMDRTSSYGRCKWKTIFIRRTYGSC